MTQLQQLGKLGFLAKQTASLRIKSLTKQAIKMFKEQGKEVTLENIWKKLEGIDKMVECGFEKEWLEGIINKEIKKCT